MSKALPWWKPFQPAPPPGPYIAMIKTFDIAETIAACIRNAREGMVAVVLSRRGGRQMMEAAEEAAAERGARVIWWNGPYDKECGW